MKCSNPACNRGIGLISYQRWICSRRYCSRRCRNAAKSDASKLTQKRNRASLEHIAGAFVAFFGLLVPASLAVAALVVPPRHPEAVQSSVCDRDLAYARAGVVAMQVRVNSLAGVDRSEICAATRFYFLEVVKARAVTALCKSGPERDRDLGHLDADVNRINDAIAAQCP